MKLDELSKRLNNQTIRLFFVTFIDKWDRTAFYLVFPLLLKFAGNVHFSIMENIFICTIAFLLYFGRSLARVYQAAWIESKQNPSYQFNRGHFIGSVLVTYLIVSLYWLWVFTF